MKTYRDQGAKGALLDEYEKALTELKTLIKDLSQAQLTTLVDKETADEDCRSIQTILSHILRSGYTYVIMIRNHEGETLEIRNKTTLDSSTKYCIALDEMFAYNLELFEDYPQLSLENFQPKNKIISSWGQRYDVEQLYEHAIVHILRHRRQIERFLVKLDISCWTLG